MHGQVSRDATRYWADNAIVADYVTAVLGTHDPHRVLLALSDVACSMGQLQVARAAGLQDSCLCEQLAPAAQPSFATVLKVVQAMGMRLTVQAA